MLAAHVLPHQNRQGYPLGPTRRILGNCGLNTAQSATAQLLVANRLIEPMSEWALIDWAERTALPELLGVRITKTTKDRLYHVGDALFAKRKPIETALRDVQGKLFESRGGIVLYLININRGSRAGFAEEFSQGTFETVPGRDPASPVEVRTIAAPENPGGLLVLCRSALRREKELAMISKAEQRFLKDTGALRERLAKGRLKDAGKIERAIGRLLKSHPRVTLYYTLRHDPGQPGSLEIRRDDEQFGQAGELCGNYVLRTDQPLGAAGIWSLYMTLLQAEEGFACLKGSSLLIRNLG
jgi:hypothetical protein